MNFNSILIKVLTRNKNNIGMLNKNLIISSIRSSSYRSLISCNINTTTNCQNNNRSAVLPIITKRLLYSSRSVNTINKWYTTTELKTEMNETEMYSIIANMTEDQRNSFIKALTLWESEKVKGQLEERSGRSDFRFHDLLDLPIEDKKHSINIFDSHEVT